MAREKLEIDILSDAKSGIFGLVGAKKATIRAMRVEIADTVSTLLAEKEEKSGRGKDGKRRSGTQEGDAAQPDKASARTLRTEAPKDKEAADPKESASKDQSSRGTGSRGRSAGAGGRGEPSAKHSATVPDKVLAEQAGPDANASGDSGDARLAKEKETGSGGSPRREKGQSAKGRKGAGRTRPLDADAAKNRPPDAGEPGQKEGRGPEHSVGVTDSALADSAPEGLFAEDAHDFSLEAGREEMPELSLDDCDQDMVFAVVREVVLSLVEPIVGPVPCQVEIVGRRVRATLDCGDTSGLLVGRDGQTLAAVQYLAARIVSRRLDGAVRLQIDAGKYRERQDDKLRELALALAERVKESGRSQSTRPLSAYQRRIVHLALEHDPAVLTRSKGEGSQRRVVVYSSKEPAVAGGKGVPEQRDDESEASIRPAPDMSDPYRLIVPGAVERTAGLGAGATGAVPHTDQNSGVATAGPAGPDGPERALDEH